MKKWQKVLILCVSCVCLLATMLIPSFAYTIDTENYKVSPTRDSRKAMVNVHTDALQCFYQVYKLPYAMDNNCPDDYMLDCKSTDWLNIHIGTESNRSIYDVGMVRLAYNNHTQIFNVEGPTGDLVFTVTVDVPRTESEVLHIDVSFPGPYSWGGDMYITVDVYPS